MPDPNFVATVIAEGQRYTQWETVQVRFEYGNPIMDFMFTASEFTDGAVGWSNIRLKPGDPVQILLGGIQAINGQIVARTANYDSESHELVVQGKSLTDALRSSVKVKPGTYNGQTFQAAAQSVLGQVGLKLNLINPPAIISKPFKTLSVQYGETIGEFIERIAMMRNVFISDDSQGNVVASNAEASSETGAQLVEGVNILRATCTLDNQDMWAWQRLVGQQTDPDSPIPPRDYSSTVNNPNSGTNRGNLIISEHPGDAQDLTARANLEAQKNLWPSVRCTVVVTGWKKSDGTLWIPAYGAPQKVTLVSPSAFPNLSGSMDLFIRSVVCAQDSENGTTTTLELVNPQGLGSSIAAVGAEAEEPGNMVQNQVPPARADSPDYSGNGNDYPALQ